MFVSNFAQVLLGKIIYSKFPESMRESLYQNSRVHIMILNRAALYSAWLVPCPKEIFGRAVSLSHVTMCVERLPTLHTFS